MKTAILIFVASALLAAQTPVISFADVANMATAAAGTLTLETTVTGSAGSTCVLYKVSGATINAVWKCSNGKNVVGPVVITATGTAAFLSMVPFAEILCGLGVNPTASASTVIAAPANGVAWQCWSGGALTSGSFVWP